MKVSISDNPHNRDLMADDENITKVVNRLWGIGAAQPKAENHKMASSNVSVDSVTEKNMTDVHAPAIEEEIRVSPMKRKENYSTKTEKNNKDNLQKIWCVLLETIKNWSVYDIAQLASPYKIEDGILKISVPTKFAEDSLRKYNNEILTAAANLDSKIIGVKISAAYNNSYYVRIHNKIISDDNISNSAFRVYCALLAYRNNATLECRVGLRQFSKESGISTSTIQEAFKILEKENYIKRTGAKNFRFLLVEETEKKGK